MFKTKKKQLKNLRDLQAQSLNSTNDDYTVGLYNGLELALSIVEGREPEFKTCVREPEVIKIKEETGRTIASGVIKRKTTGG